MDKKLHNLLRDFLSSWNKVMIDRTKGKIGMTESVELVNALFDNYVKKITNLYQGKK